MTEQISRDEEPAYKRYAPFLNSSYNLYVHIYMTHKALFSVRYGEIKGFEVTPMELALLTIVNGIGGSATPAEIARWIMRKRSTVSGLLNRMERNGLIKRSEYENNKKLKKVTLTDEGRKILEQTGESDVLNDITGSLSDDEFERLWSLLEKLQQIATKDVK
ncbi:MAG: winged helix DNA-binding protein [Chloroflexota bacterium]|nr:winged helix DNA-binding protein [Chloroflexota bacterium]